MSVVGYIPLHASPISQRSREDNQRLKYGKSVLNSRAKSVARFQ